MAEEEKLNGMTDELIREKEEKQDQTHPRQHILIMEIQLVHLIKGGWSSSPSEKVEDPEEEKLPSAPSSSC